MVGSAGHDHIIIAAPPLADGVSGEGAPRTYVGSGGLDGVAVRLALPTTRRARRPPPALGTAPVGTVIETLSTGARRWGRQQKFGAGKSHLNKSREFTK